MLTIEQKRLQRIKNLGTGMLGKKHSDITKKKMSGIAKGRKPSKETREAVSRANQTRVVTKETRKKMSDTHIGDRHPMWKGGVYKFKNRVFIYCPNHPNAVNNHVRRSHLVAEKALGRYLDLQNGETVHHVNGDPGDDRNENLLISKNKYHSWLHAKMQNFLIGKNALIQEFPEGK